MALGNGALNAAGAEAAAAVPETSVSLRGVGDGVIEVAEPLRVAVRVNVPDEHSGQITLAPTKGSWVDATTVELLSADGNRVIATAEAVAGTSAPSVILDQDNAVHGLWWFPESTMAAAASGDYLVRAKLVISDGGGWRGESLSEPAPLKVVAASNDPARLTQRVLARAHAAALRNEPAKAAEILDEVLNRDPDNVPVLEMRAALCLHGGNAGSAFVCINRARTLAARQGGHPSWELHEFASKIEVAMAANPGAGAPVPAGWSSAPRSVFAALRPSDSEIAGRAGVAPANAAKTKVAASPPVTTAQLPGLAPVPAAPAGSVSVVAPAAVTAGPGVVVPSTELSDARISADPAGQWAASATAGSQYGKTQYSAMQATGAPNVSVAGNSPDAWCPAVRDKGMDWLDVTFAKPVRATELRVRQNDAAGAITKIEAIEANGTAHVWWEGADPYKAAGVREIVWFAVRVPKTDYAVARVKLTLNLASGPGYKEIDAVQLVGAMP